MSPPNTDIETNIRGRANSVTTLVGDWKFIPTTHLTHQMGPKQDGQTQVKPVTFNQGYLGSLWINRAPYSNHAISIKGWVIALVPQGASNYICEVYHEATVYHFSGMLPNPISPREFLDFFADLFALIFLRKELLELCAGATGVCYDSCGTSLPGTLFEEISRDPLAYAGEGSLSYSRVFNPLQ